MNTLVFCFTVVGAVRAGYVPDFGLSPDALDFTPSDQKADDYDFTPEEYKQNRRSDHDDHKLPAPTSYSQFNLVSKNAIPIKFKVPAPEPEWKKPEWKPKKPAQWKPSSAVWKPKKPEWQPKEPEWPQPPMSWSPGSEEEHGWKSNEEKEPALNTHPVPSPGPSHGPWENSPPSDSHGWQSD